MPTEKPSVCPLDCPDTCSLLVDVDANRIERIRGSRANPFTEGVLCNKVTRYYPEFVHGKARLRRPLVRTGPKGGDDFEPVGWDAAIDRVHDGLAAVVRAHGPEAIVPLNYAGPHGLLAGGSLDLRFFHALGASRLTRGSMCGGVRGEAWLGTYGATPGMPPGQVEQAGLVVVWGNNATVSNLHLMRPLNRAKRAGARIVVVDPMRTKVAEQSHLHLAVRPGTDAVLAFALAVELERTGGLDRDFIAAHVSGFDAYMDQAREYPPERAADICGLEASDIRILAQWYRDTPRAAIALGNGLERNHNGGSGVRAVLALPALAGKFGAPGGGVVMAAGHAFPKTAARLTRPDLAPAGTRTLDILDVGRHLTEDDVSPPIRGLFIYNHNPLVVHPDQNRMRRGLAREDVFIVGCDLTLTDSLRYADVILPACSHFEHDDLFVAYGQQFVQRAEPVIPPVGEALPNTEIFRRLAARFGLDDPALTADDRTLMDDALDATDPRLGGKRPSELPTGTALPMLFDGEEPALFGNVSPATPSGRVELESAYLDERHGRPLPGFEPVADDHPLVLISPASDRRTSSTFGGLAPSDAAPALQMHPDDAHARGLESGAWVRVFNELGEVRLRLRVTDAVRAGVVGSEKGAWLRTSDNGQTVSALAPATRADLGGACFNDARVEVESA